MPDILKLLLQALFIGLLYWAIRRDFFALKKWVEGLVASLRQPLAEEPTLVTTKPCIACGRPENEDFAHCPTCDRSWLDKGICGQRWTALAVKGISKPHF